MVGLSNRTAVTGLLTAKLSTLFHYSNDQASLANILPLLNTRGLDDGKQTLFISTSHLHVYESQDCIEQKVKVCIKNVLNIGREIPIQRAQRIYHGADVRGFKPVVVNFQVFPTNSILIYFSGRVFVESLKLWFNWTHWTLSCLDSWQLYNWS